MASGWDFQGGEIPALPPEPPIGRWGLQNKRPPSGLVMAERCGERGTAREQGSSTPRPIGPAHLLPLTPPDLASFMMSP